MERKNRPENFAQQPTGTRWSLFWNKAKLPVQIENTSSKLCFGAQKIKILDCSYHHQEAPFYFKFIIKKGEEIIFVVQSDNRMVRARKPDQAVTKKKRNQVEEFTEQEESLDEAPKTKKLKNSNKQPSPVSETAPAAASNWEVYAEMVPELQSFNLELDALLQILPANPEMRKIAITMMQQKLVESLETTKPISATAHTIVPDFDMLGTMVQTLQSWSPSISPKTEELMKMPPTPETMNNNNIFLDMERLIGDN